MATAFFGGPFFGGEFFSVLVTVSGSGHSVVAVGRSRERDESEIMAALAALVDELD